MKRIFINISLIFTFFFQTQHTFSQNHKIITTEFRQRTLPFGLTESVPVQKPKVALVLSGGGARGAAQVGIMRALIENNIEFDLIVGTSIGSVIGGLYASGYTIDQLDSILVNTNWEDITALTEQRRRTDLFVDQKITEDRNILTLRLSGLTPVIPTSVSTGQKFTNFLNLLIFQAPIHVQNNFDELLIPFRAICTDIKSGKEIIIADGDISEAMRASSSVSFLLSPIERDTMLLADGGLVANIPTIAAKNLGADIIIAVNTTSPLRKFEELDVPWYMADQVVSIPMKLLESEALKVADVVIEPEIEHLSTDFKGLDTLIEIGYQTTLNQIEKIKTLINKKYEQNLQEKSFQISDLIYVHHPEPTIDSISLSYSKRNKLSSSQILDDFYKISNGNINSVKLTLQEKEDITIPKFEVITQPSIKEILINGIKYSQFQNESKYFDDLLNKPFNSRILSDRLIQFLRYHRNSGYALIDINRVEFDSTNCTLRIETTPGLIDSIVIQGNNKTNISIIQREILVNAGEMFDISKVSNSLTNLNATNLFEQTFAFLDNNGLRKNLIFKVKEKNSGLIRFGIRGDNERNLQVAADLRDENFFGTATEIGFLINGGLKNRYFGLEYRSNRVLKTFFTYKIKSYYDLIDRFTYADEPTTDVQEWSRVQVGEYREIKYGLSLAIGTQIEKLGNIYIEARREKHQIKSLFGLGYEPADYDFFGIRVGSIFDSQNRYPFPTDGVLISVHYETSQKILGGDISYSKIHFSYEAYHTYFSRHTIVPKFVFGFADITLPLAEQFHLGGQNSFFGLRENDFIGRQLFLASLEYRFLLPFKIFFETYFKVRYDLGSAWLTPTSIRYKDFRHGIGVSLSFDTPIGPANFSIGRGFFVRNDLLKKPLSFGPYEFYFEIGYPM